MTRLEVHRTQRWLVSLNMYPYNPGHLLILPQRHVEVLQELEVEEVQEKHALEVTCLQVLNDLYSPGGFNVGLNLGHSSGASIAHLHVHVVPRFNRELGFIDVIGGAKIMVEEPLKTQARLRKAFRKGG